jgi:hypothetical protein
MSERGRGPDERVRDGDDAVGEHDAEDFVPPPQPARRIAPYDPYQSRTGDVPPSSTRNVAAEPFQPPTRSRTRGRVNDPFLPDDDPLNAEAWQLDLDEAVIPDEGDEAIPSAHDLAAPVPPRRARRPPASTRDHATAATSERRTRRARAAASKASVSAPRPAITIGMPRAVSGSSLVADQLALALLGINVASVVVMALILGMRVGGIPSPTVLQLDAAGNPNLWGPPSVLWRLPLMAFFLTVMFLVVAWFLHPPDRFAARFALGAAAVAQAITWVAVIQHLA